MEDMQSGNKPKRLDEPTTRQGVVASPNPARRVADRIQPLNLSLLTIHR